MTPLPILSVHERKQLFWFFVLAFFMLAAGYGLREPWPADEPRFVLVAKQMVESGNYLFPHRGIQLYPDKPPVFFWILAACYHLTGSWRWSFLLPSLFSGMAVLYFSHDLARRLWNPKAGLWAAAAILFSVQFVYQFKRAQIDPTLVLFTTIAFYGIARHLLLGPHWRWFYAGCFFAGLGVITKGVGFLPLLAIIPYIGLRLAKADGLSDIGKGNVLRWSLGLVVFFFAIALWLAPLLWVALNSGIAEHQLYLDNILFKQTAERYANPWHHFEPFWYFGEIILLFWMPFSLSFFWLWKNWLQSWRSRDARVLLPLGWAILVVLFFSLSSGKRDMYILPALPAFALAAAPFLQAISERKNFRVILMAFVVLLSIVLFGIGISALVGQPGFEQKQIEARGVISLDALWWFFSILGLGGLLATVYFGTRSSLIACAVFFTMLWAGYGFVVHPALDDFSSSKALMQKARQLAGAGTQIGLVDWKEQNLLQATGPVVDFGFLKPAKVQLEDASSWMLQAPRQRRIFLQVTDQSVCVNFKAADAIMVGKANRRDWFLLGPDSVARCVNSKSGMQP